MLDTYLAQLARCATGNQFNRLHITLENLLAPAEMCALIDGVRERERLAVPPAAIQWLDRMDAMLRGGGRRVQGYVRRALAAGRDRLHGARRRQRAGGPHARRSRSPATRTG